MYDCILDFYTKIQFTAYLLFHFPACSLSFVQSKVSRQFLAKFANLGSVKCDPYVKHLFLWLFIELQHKLCERYLDIRDEMLKSAQWVCITEFVSGQLF